MLNGKMVSLVSGKEVSSSGQEWRVECEARHLLKMPLKERRAALVAREEKRGKQAVDALRNVMADVHAAMKKG